MKAMAKVTTFRETGKWYDKFEVEVEFDDYPEPDEIYKQTIGANGLGEYYAIVKMWYNGDSLFWRLFEPTVRE